MLRIAAAALCNLTLWSQNISRCSIIFSHRGGSSSLHMPSCKRSALKCTSLIPPRWRCRPACFCTFPLMVADGRWVVFWELLSLSSLSLVLCAALKVKKGGKIEGPSSGRWAQTLLHTLSTVHTPFSAPHLSLTIMSTGASSWSLVCKRCHREPYVMHQRLYMPKDSAEKKEDKPAILGICLPPFFVETCQTS